MKATKILLQPADFSHQRFPCSYATDVSHCTARSLFRVYPDRIRPVDDWPDTQSCTAHLGSVIREAIKRYGTPHFGVRVVAFRESA